MLQYYLWIKALHIISMVAWMAGMFYLPRLFVYHAAQQNGSDAAEMLKIMERKLLRVIINPAMILTWIFGIWLVALNPDLLHQHWLHGKFALVLLMSGLHGYLARLRKKFAIDANPHSGKFYRYINEIPTLLLVGIVLLVVLKPF
jgi:putative membrane protein